MNIDELIAEGERLKGVHYDDPDQHLWDNDVREIVKPYGDTTYKILQGILNPSSVIWGDDDSQYMQERIEAITKVQKLFDSLKKRSAQKQAAQSATITPNFEQAKQKIQEKIINYNINAPTTFGANTPISQITIGELFAGIEKEISEKVEDEETKKSLLNRVKSITSDPTFSSIASIAASTIINKLLGT